VLSLGVPFMMIDLIDRKLSFSFVSVTFVLPPQNNYTF
jgi:hypothetical protein